MMPVTKLHKRGPARSMNERLERAIESMIAGVNRYREQMLRPSSLEARAVAEALYRESRAALAALFLFSRGSANGR